MSMADDDWLESICKETPMSMTKEELRPEEGEPEERGEHNPAEGWKDVHLLQAQAWEAGVRVWAWRMDGKEWVGVGVTTLEYALLQNPYRS